MIGLKLANSRLQTECLIQCAKQLKNYCWEGVELIHFVHCIMVFIISQLWLTSHLRSTVVLLDTGTACTSTEITAGMPIMGLELTTPR